MSCLVGTHRTSSDASVPMTTWAESAFCHKVAILISSSNLGSRSCKSLRCSSDRCHVGVGTFLPFLQFTFPPGHKLLPPLLFARYEVMAADDDQ